jgi:molybdopterin-guanine dinucleotide biosynthesis protein
MAIIVIGGHSRNVGKTSVVAGIIAALPEYDWTALKITQYGHGICSKDGEACHCATDDHNWAISEEKDRSAATDTSRFLQAGAARVYWIRTQQGLLAEAMPAIRRRLAQSQNAIIESNSLIKFIRPDLYLTVLDPATADFKTSAQEYLDRADGVILHQRAEKSAWRGVSLKPIIAKPVFQISQPDYVTPEIVEFIQNRLSTGNRQLAI